MEISMDITKLKALRAEKWNEAKAFLDSKTTGFLTEEEGNIFKKMEDELDSMAEQIKQFERFQETSNFMNSPTSQPLVSNIGKHNIRSGDSYTRDFWNALRGRGITNALAVGDNESGGYLVPEEFANELVQALEEQNVFRRIARIVSTNSEKLKVPIATASGVANWVEEGEVIPESDSKFGQVILNAFKLGTMMRASTELVEDSAFNIQTYIAQEFARRIGAREEEAFCIGDGVGKPTGVFIESGGGGSVGATAASATEITFDDIIDLFYSLKPPYRSKAVFLTNDTAMKQLRKVKDSNGQYIWQPAVTAGTPEMLLGRPVFTSPYVPEIAAGSLPLAFGDFSFYWIADRRDIRFKVLNELFAERDQIGFHATERIDGKMILSEAVKLLKMGD
jgi:HK97 family phage major capsid protein